MTLPAGLLGDPFAQADPQGMAQPPFPVTPPGPPPRQSILDRILSRIYNPGQLPSAVLSPQQIQSQQNQGLINTGLGLLSASGHRPQGSGNTGIAGIAQALLAGRQGFQQDIEGAAKNALALQGIEASGRRQQALKQIVEKYQPTVSRETPEQLSQRLASMLSEAIAVGGPEGNDVVTQITGALNALKERENTPPSLTEVDAGDHIELVDRAGNTVRSIQKAKAPGANEQTVEQRVASTGQLRSQFNGEQAVQRAGVVATFYPQIAEAAGDPSPAGDLAIVFGIMKLFDPSSSVREGEQATAANAGGVPAWVRSKWNQLIGGGVLSEALRKDYLRTAEKIVKTHRSQVDRIVKRYSGIAERNGLNPEDVIDNPLIGAAEGPLTPKALDAKGNDILSGYLGEPQ